MYYIWYLQYDMLIITTLVISVIIPTWGPLWACSYVAFWIPPTRFQGVSSKQPSQFSRPIHGSWCLPGGSCSPSTVGTSNGALSGGGKWDYAKQWVTSWIYLRIYTKSMLFPSFVTYSDWKNQAKRAWTRHIFPLIFQHFHRHRLVLSITSAIAMALIPR